MEFKDLITEEPAMDKVVEMQSINKERTEQEIINDLKELARVEGELVSDGPIDFPTFNVAADYCINEGVKEVSTSVQEDTTTGVQNTAVGSDEGLGWLETVFHGGEDPTPITGDAHLQEAMYPEPEPEIERITGATVQSSAAKVSFTCGVWTAAVTDKRATQQVEHANNKSNVGKFKKELLVGFQPVKELNYLGGLGRNTHYGLTHPFGKSGDYIVPTIDLPTYVQEISGIVQRFVDAKDSITKSSYDDALIDEQLRLGPLYNADDYPTFEDLKDKYHMSFSVDPIPESFVTNLEASQAKEINDYYQQQHAERMEKFSNAVFAESLKHIKKLRDSLDYSGESKKSNPDYKVFKESTYAHVEDTIRVLERFNFGGDARMQAAHKILRDAFVGKSVEMLKHSEGLREEAKKSLDDAIAALPSLDI
tara:strand:- start:362 stop:1630 length:1269 start_codon:yes stop_codon:yes gene_type:complete